MKFSWLLSIILVTGLLFSLTDARKFEKGRKHERGKKNGVEINASNKSVETAVKKEEKETSISPDGNHNNKELRLVSVSTTAVHHNRRLHGEHKRRNHKRGHHKRHHHKHSRNHKRNHKEGHQRIGSNHKRVDWQKKTRHHHKCDVDADCPAKKCCMQTRNGKVRVCKRMGDKPCFNKHSRHAQKRNHVAGKLGTNTAHNMRNHKKGFHFKNNDRKHAHGQKRKADLKKCNTEADCPSKGCCVQTRGDGSGKVCRHEGHKACTNKFGEHAQKHKHKQSKGKKTKPGRVAESLDLKGKENKFLEKSLRAIKMMKAKLKRVMRRNGDKRKTKGRKP